MLDRDPQRHLAAERIAEQVDLVEPELSSQLRDIVGHQLGPQRPVDVGRAAVALEVGQDHPPACRHDRGERLARADPAVQHHQRLARAVLFVVQAHEYTTL